MGGRKKTCEKVMNIEHRKRARKVPRARRDKRLEGREEIVAWASMNEGRGKNKDKNQESRKER